MNQATLIDDECVLRRVAEGDVPILDASLSLKSRFKSGVEIPHQVMLRLADSGKLKVPSQRGLPWSVVDSSFAYVGGVS